MAAGNKLYDFMTGVMGQHPPRVRSWLGSLDDATAAKMMAAAEAGDTRTILKAMAAEKDWGVTPRAPEPVAPAGGSRSPMSFEDRVSNDPNIRRAIEASGAQMPTGGVEDVLGAYRGTFSKSRRGRPASAEDSIRELSKPADQVAAENIAGQFDQAAYNPRPDWPQGRSRALKVARESYPAEYDIGAEDLMDPELLSGLTPQYRRLLQELEKNDWLGFDYPSQAVSSILEYGDAPSRWEMTPDLLEARDVVIFAPGPSSAIPPAPARQMELPFPEPAAAPPPRRPAPVDDMTFDEVPSRPMTPKPAPRKFPKRAAAAAVGGAAGIGLMMSGDDEPAMTSGGEADLVEESRPAPKVAAQDVQPTAIQAPRDYSLEARALINRLNDMRRAAGGEVPEAPAMMAEINRLMALGNQTRRATMVAAPQDDASRLYQQAQSMIDQVNQMYRQGMTPNSPEVQRIMSQVRRLQAQGDAIRNRRSA